MLSLQIGPLTYREVNDEVWDEFFFKPVTTHYVDFKITEMYNYSNPAFIEIQFWTDPLYPEAVEATVFLNEQNGRNGLDQMNKENNNSLLAFGKANKNEESGAYRHYLRMKILLVIGIFILNI